MNELSIISDIRKIISLESLDCKKYYKEIEKISLAAIYHIKKSEIIIDNDLYQFLDDFDIRNKDSAYRKFQTRKVENILSRFES